MTKIVCCRIYRDICHHVRRVAVYGAASKKASPKHQILVDAFVQRIDMVLALDRQAVDTSTTIKKQLEKTASHLVPTTQR